MKHIKFFLFGLLFFFISGITFSQVVTYNDAEGLFSDSHVSKLEKAEKIIDRADASLNKAMEIESKYQKFKAKKMKKYDKKTWEAKKIRIDVERNYQKAYEEAYEVYSEIIQGATFYNDRDKNEATALDQDAGDNLEQSDNKMKSYTKSLMDSKALKKMSSSSLNSAINTSRNYKEGAYNKQKEALDLVLDQDRKKQLDEQDDLAWQNAQDLNTIESYQEYLSGFSQGKYASQARQMIQQLQADAEKDNEPVMTDFKFQVQIAASRTPLSNYELKARYSNTNEIERIKIGHMFKYRVGEFYNYADAAQFRDQLTNSYSYKSRETPFIVVFDKNGNQIEVTDDMKR